jgi:hypothetical protein
MTDEHEPADDFAARVAQQFRETFTRDLATVMEAGIDEQNKRLTDIAERFERKDREMSDETHSMIANRIAKAVERRIGATVIASYNGMSNHYTFSMKEGGVLTALGAFSVEAIEGTDETVIVGQLNDVIASGRWIGGGAE